MDKYDIFEWIVALMFVGLLFAEYMGWLA